MFKKVKLNPKNFVGKLKEKMELKGDPILSQKMNRFMKGKLDHYGLHRPQRKEVVKELLSEYELDSLNREAVHEMLTECYKYPQREMQYCGYYLLEEFWLDRLDEEDLPVLEDLIQQRSWWDSTDLLSKYFGIILKEDKELRTKYNEQYVSHENMWMRRISLIFQLYYKEEMDQEIIFSNIRLLWGEDDFFIRKAIGWILREHGKFKPQEVIDFVKENEKELSHLSKVEALRYMIKNKKKSQFADLDIPVYVKKRGIAK